MASVSRLLKPGEPNSTKVSVRMSSDLDIITMLQSSVTRFLIKFNVANRLSSTSARSIVFMSSKACVKEGVISFSL